MFDKDMVKVRHQGYILYFNKRIFEKEVIVRGILGSDSSCYQMLQLADVVIDPSENRLVKCRYKMEDIIDNSSEQVAMSFDTTREGLGHDGEREDFFCESDGDESHPY